MKLQIDEIPNLEETEILIKCREIDSKITKISYSYKLYNCQWKIRW